MKYDWSQTVEAQYSRNIGQSEANPFLEALPEMLDKTDFYEQIKSIPPMPYGLETMSSADRRRCLYSIYTLFYPMDYMYSIYDVLYRSILNSCTTSSVVRSIRQLHLLQGDGSESRSFHAEQAESCSILGFPGIGKTSTIRRCLSLIPQVIIHKEYHGKPFYNKQITHLIVECPSDCSIKTLGYNIAAAIDEATGSEYFDRMSRVKSLSASAIATQIKIICLTYHVGVLVIDEIQNAIVTAKHNKQIKPLVKFLVELTNDTGTAVCFVGTPEAEELFCMQEHLKRRTRGLRLLPMKSGSVYKNFLSVLWSYQYTIKKATLTDRISNVFLDLSSGVPAYIIKLFCESQVQAILTGKECIDVDTVMNTSNILSIRVPKIFCQGTHISDFSVSIEEHLPNNEDEVGRTSENSANEEIQSNLTGRQITVGSSDIRGGGRKKVLREKQDLVELFKRTKDEDKFLIALEKLGMREDEC